MTEKHEIDDETMDIHFNVLQMAINEKGRTTMSMTIFPLFRQEIMKIDLFEDLSEKCVALHLLISHKARVIIIVEKMRGGGSILTVRMLKIMKVQMKNFYTIAR